MEDIVKVAFFSEKNEDGTLMQDLKFATENSACVDIRCKGDYLIYPDQGEMISTGLYVSIPNGYEMQIRPRSGLSAKTALIFKNTIGTIDSDYRGREIFVLWYNLGPNEYRFKHGDRIAQAKIEKVLPVVYYEVDSIETLKLMGDDRGGGFGHTGMR
jgi:dUTP pyrophosphatase